MQTFLHVFFDVCRRRLVSERRQSLAKPFIRQMPASIWAHLATTPDSTSLESLAVLADRGLASETDVKDSSMGVDEVRVNDRERLWIMEDISKRLKKLKTSGNQKKQFNNKDQTENRSNRATNKKTFFANANARPFTLWFLIVRGRFLIIRGRFLIIRGRFLIIRERFLIIRGRFLIIRGTL